MLKLHRTLSQLAGRGPVVRDPGMTSVSGQESSRGQVLPEESVMLNADLPQFLGGFVVWQLEANCALILLLLLGKK